MIVEVLKLYCIWAGLGVVEDAKFGIGVGLIVVGAGCGLSMFGLGCGWMIVAGGGGGLMPPGWKRLLF